MDEVEIVEGEISFRELFTAFVNAKVYKSLGAALLLCKNGFGEDAFVVCRSIWELVITYLYIMQDPTEDRLARYSDYDWVQRNKMYTQYISKRPGLDHTDDESKQIRDEVFEQSKLMQAKYNYNSNGWSDKKISEMAEAVDKGWEYQVIYKLQCMFSHTNPRSMNEYMSPDKTKAVLNFGESENWIGHAISVGFECFIDIAKKNSETFGWGIENELDDISSKFLEEFRKVNISSKSLDTAQ